MAPPHERYTIPLFNSSADLSTKMLGSKVFVARHSPDRSPLSPSGCRSTRRRSSNPAHAAAGDSCHAVLRLGDEEDRAVGAEIAVDHRRRRDSHLRRKLAASLVVGRRLASSQRGCRHRGCAGFASHAYTVSFSVAKYNTLWSAARPSDRTDTTAAHPPRRRSARCRICRTWRRSPFVGVRWSRWNAGLYARCRCATSARPAHCLPQLPPSDSGRRFRLPSSPAPGMSPSTVVACAVAAADQCKGLRNSRCQCCRRRNHGHARRQILRRHIDCSRIAIRCSRRHGNRADRAHLDRRSRGERASATKSGGGGAVTVSATVAVCVSTPDVPVIVTVALPMAASAVA